MSFKPFIAASVLFTLIADSTGYAYQAPEQIQKLNITIVEGEGAVNNIRQRLAREPMVQVTDENRKPVAGAAVVFLLPNQGAGGVFANGARSLTTLTDANGNAVARGMQANRLTGQYQMRVTASAQGQTVSASIGMSNAALAGAAAAGVGITLKTLLIIGAVGGAAAAGAVVAVNSGGGSNGNGGSGGGGVTRPPTTVTPGTPSVGGPR